MQIVIAMIFLKVDEPVPWGFLLFLGLGYVLYLVLVMNWLNTSFADKLPAIVQQLVLIILSPIVFLGLIVCVHQLSALFWGDGNSNLVGIVIELLVIGIALVRSR